MVYFQGNLFTLLAFRTEVGTPSPDADALDRSTAIGAWLPITVSDAERLVRCPLPPIGVLVGIDAGSAIFDAGQ
jgi:hypothetical protein